MGGGRAAVTSIADTSAGITRSHRGMRLRAGSFSHAMFARGDRKTAATIANDIAAAFAKSAVHRICSSVAWSPLDSARAMFACGAVARARGAERGLGRGQLGLGRWLAMPRSGASSCNDPLELPSSSSSSTGELERLSFSIGVLIMTTVFCMTRQNRAGCARTERSRCNEMYTDTAFLDRTLAYGPPDESEETASGPCLGNGVVQLSIDATDGLASATETFYGTDPSLCFTELRPTNTLEISARKLHMSAGAWRCEGEVVLDETDPAAKTTVSVDSLALRQVSECVVQCIDTGAAVEFTHVVRAPPSMTIVRSEVAIHNVYGTTVAVLVVDGLTNAGNQVAYCCYYVSANSVESVRGLKTTIGESSASGRIEVTIQTTAGAPRLDLLHTVIHGSSATSYEAVAHAARLFRSDSPLSTSVLRLRTTHALRWTALWNGDLVVSERSDASDQDRESLKIFNIHVRTSIYALYTATRDPNAILSRWCNLTRPVSANNHDFDGDSDAFATPALLSIAPWVAWLQPPRQRASAWTPLHLIARTITDMWHGYRATLDRPRLDLLFQTLRLDLAELDMRIEMQGDPGSLASVGTSHTIRATDVDDDAYTIGIARRAFAAAEQISNTLRIPPDPQWAVKRDALGAPLASPTSRALAETPAGNYDGIILLHPAMLDVYAATTDLGPIAPVIEDNVTALSSTASAPIDAQVPEVAFSAIAALASDARRLASFEEGSDRMDSMFAAFMERAGESVHPKWGSATSDRIRLAASVVACVTFGFLGVRFQGYVTRDGYHTVPANLLPAPAVTILPSQWYIARHFVTPIVRPPRRTARAKLSSVYRCDRCDDTLMSVTYRLENTELRNFEMAPSW